MCDMNPEIRTIISGFLLCLKFEVYIILLFLKKYNISIVSSKKRNYNFRQKIDYYSEVIRYEVY